MKITKEDVGRKVRCGNGDIEVIKEFDDTGSRYPVQTNIASYTSEGTWIIGGEDLSDDLVAFVDEEMEETRKSEEKLQIEAIESIFNKMFTFGQAVDYLAENPDAVFDCTDSTFMGLCINGDYLRSIDSNATHVRTDIILMRMKQTFKLKRRQLVYKSVTELLEEGFEFKTHGFVKNDIHIEFELLCDLGKDIDLSELQPFDGKTFNAIIKEKK